MLLIAGACVEAAAGASAAVTAELTNHLGRNAEDDAVAALAIADPPIAIVLEAAGADYDTGAGAAGTALVRGTELPLLRAPSEYMCRLDIET
ncbi:unnamed protein product [Phytophthora fragariaefolia]|uniref:Unnamed protein product n=1 Tax=Phytophthora fragariaefolia TaxID=1490495 RepID=A0A9W6XAI4_9STRA|nr:unnamed protein product [Phytophthora fragariaefolia]